MRPGSLVASVLCCFWLLSMHNVVCKKYLFEFKTANKKRYFGTGTDSIVYTTFNHDMSTEQSFDGHPSGVFENGRRDKFQLDIPFMQVLLTSSYV